MPNMKIAICGVWHVHAADYLKAARAHAEVIGAWDADPARCAAFCEKHDLPQFDSLDALLASDADGVVVCTATSDHADVMVRLADAGKHIFTEKVLALTSADCDRIANAVERNGVRFVISMVQKYRAEQLTVKRVVESGVLGKVNYLRFCNCHNGSTGDWLPDHFYSAAECGGGAMIDLGAHGMYLTEWLLGMPEAAQSTFTVAHENPRNADRVEDNAVTVMRYADGTIAVNETGFVSSGKPMTLEVSGDRGYVRMCGGKVTVTAGGKTEEVELEAAQPAPIVQFLTDRILPGCGMAEAKRLTRMMEMAY